MFWKQIAPLKHKNIFLKFIKKNVFLLPWIGYKASFASIKVKCDFLIWLDSGLSCFCKSVFSDLAIRLCDSSDREISDCNKRKMTLQLFLAICNVNWFLIVVSICVMGVKSKGRPMMWYNVSGINLARSSCMIVSYQTGLGGDTDEDININDEQWNKNHLSGSSMLQTVNFE